MPIRKKGLLAAGALLILLGVTWSLQGSGMIGGSFMSGDSSYVFIGSFVTLLGFLLLVASYRPK